MAIIAARKPDLEDIRGALRDIAADGKRAGDVVSRSHGLLKRREPDLKPVSIDHVIQDVAALLHSESVIRHVALRMELDMSDPVVSGDTVQLQQVVLNLVVNAIEATADAPDGARHVIVRSERDGAHVRVSVTDTGVGLTREVAERMFEPFFTTKSNGLGMGLAINQAIIEGHGGRLWAKPNGGRGASVGFDLPCRVVTS